MKIHILVFIITIYSLEVVWRFLGLKKDFLRVSYFLKPEKMFKVFIELLFLVSGIKVDDVRIRVGKITVWILYDKV